MEMTTKEEAEVLLNLFSRYEGMVLQNRDKLKGLPNGCDWRNLHRLCHEAAVNSKSYPFDKMCRWMGFVQGVLAAQGILIVEDERDYTRPIFHRLYGREVPTF